MQNIIANKSKAIPKGFTVKGHRTHGDKILLNEKEILDSNELTGDLNERAKEIDGIVYSEPKVINVIQMEGWK